MKKMLLFSAVLMTVLLSAAPPPVQINVWKSLLRYHNANLTLCFPYSGISVGMQQQENYFGGFRLTLNEWQEGETMTTKVEDNGRTIRGSWATVPEASLQAELADDNTIALAFSKPDTLKQCLFFLFDRAKLEKNGKCNIEIDGQVVDEKFERGGIKSITFFTGDAAKCFTIRFGSNCAAIVNVNKKRVIFSLFPFKGEAPAEFTIIPGQE